MTAKTNKYRILETGVLLERFVTYNEVFTEYFKTIKIIERGEALRYETYARLTDNYISNIKRFIKLCNSYITKYNLENSMVAERMNNYFIDLINAIGCLDVKHNSIDYSRLENAKSRIRARQDEFVDSINILIN